MIQKTFFFFSFLLITSMSIAEIVINNDQRMVRNIQSNFSIYVDSTGRNFDEIVTLPSNVFLPLKNTLITNPDARYWVSFSIRNDTEKPQSRVINFNDPDFDEIVFYHADQNYKTGTQHLFSSRPIAHKNFVFNINLAPRETQKFYVSLRSKLHSSLSTDLSTTSELMSYSLTEYYLLGIFYGIILVLCLYNAVLYSTDRDSTHLYYILYALSCALFALNEDGLGFQFLWSRIPTINLFIHQLTPITLLVSYILYAISFTELKKYAKRSYQILISSSIIFLIYYVFHISIRQASPWWFIFYILPFSLSYYFSYQLYKKGNPSIRFFLIGNAIIILSFIVYLLRIFDLIPSGILPVYSFNFAFIAEAIILSMAVGEKVKSTVKTKQKTQLALIKSLEENDKLKDKVNRELETKVSERTQSLVKKTNDLEHANNELDLLQKKLFDMNEQLDIQNFKLQKKASRSTYKMVVAEELSLDEFLEIFPNKRACYEFIHEAKWGNTPFVCKKCGSNEFKTKDTFDRICNICFTPHSLTSSTLFHSLKFDIQKALYFAYIINLSHHHYTIEELMVKLELSKNSVWNFRNKITERIKTLKAAKKTNHISLREIIVHPTDK